MEELTKIDKKLLVKIFSQNETQTITTLLQSNKYLDIYTYKNTKGFTVLHFICFNNNYQLCELMLGYIKIQQNEGYLTELQFSQWLDTQNKEGMTALHLACFRGNYVNIYFYLEKLILLLQKYGAQHTIATHTGLTVLHMTSQGDSPLSSLYWIRRGVSIECEDDSGSTPLSLAAQMGQLNILSFLISWGANIDHQDSEHGNTPLHQACQQGHTRIVRRLIIKGANRNLRDLQGKIPLDYAIERRYKTIEIYLLNKKGFLEWSGLSQSYMKVENTKKAYYSFISIYLLQIILTTIFIFPYVDDSLWLWIYLALSLISITLFCMLKRSNPGRIPKSKDHEIIQLLEIHNNSQICPDCQIVTPYNSKHCEVCEACVSNYDHHCPWVANCIGQYNLKLFQLFLLSFLVSVILQFVMQFQRKLLYSIPDIHSKNFERFYSSDSSDGLMLLGKQFTSVMVILLQLIFIIPVSILLWVQIVNMVTGKTTYERFRDKKTNSKGKQKKDANYTNIKIPSNNQTDKLIFTSIEL